MKKENKLIAEFMGKEIYQNYHESNYHCSWDWLMPVVHKCLDIYHIEQMNDDVNFEFYDSFGDKDTTYNAVIEFINEYNKNK